MAVLSELVEKQSEVSSSKTPWGWIFSGILGLVIIIVAAVIYWQIRKLAKKVSVLEGEKLMLQAQVDDLTAQLKILPNDIEADKLRAELAKLNSDMLAKAAQLESLKTEADAKMKELETAKPW